MPEFWKAAAARITESSSPSANTTRLGLARTALVTIWNRPAEGSSRADSSIRIGVEVGDLLPGDAGLHRRFRHRRRDAGDQARIEGRGNDVFRAIDRARAAIGGGHFVGHVLARQGGDGFGGGDLHRFIDGGGAHIQRAAEDIGKAQHIVDLVGIVAAPGGDDDIAAHRLGVFRRDFRIGIGHGEDDRRLAAMRRAPCPASARPWPTGPGTRRSPPWRRPGCAPWFPPHGPTSTGSCLRCGRDRPRPWCRTG